MKLLILFPSLARGGLEEFCLVAAAFAVKQGWDVHVAFPQGDELATLVQDFETHGVRYHPLNIAERENQFGRGLHLPWLLRTLWLLLHLRPNVVHISLPYPNLCLSSILACALLRFPTIVRFGLVPPNIETVGVGPRRIKLYQWAHARNQKWITISENNRELIAKLFQISAQQLFRIYNGTQLPTKFSQNPVHQEALRQQVRQELDIATNQKILLTVARLDSQKGYEDLIPVVARIGSEFPDLKFVWVGDGDRRSYLEEQVRQFNIEHQVLFLGYRSDVPRLLQAADFFVFPTHFEGGQSFAIAEAMAYGLPIISSNASGIPEVIEHQVHGLIFPVGDREELLKTLRWALQHPDLMSNLGRMAQSRAQEFSEEAMMQQYLAIWRSFTSSSTSTPYNTHALSKRADQKG